MKRSNMTPAKRAELRDFEQRMRDASAAEQAAKDFRKAERQRVSKWHESRQGERRRRTPQFVVARAFKAGSGKLS